MAQSKLSSTQREPLMTRALEISACFKSSNLLANDASTDQGFDKSHDLFRCRHLAAAFTEP
jgi:hypothetical protein